MTREADWVDELIEQAQAQAGCVSGETGHTYAVAAEFTGPDISFPALGRGVVQSELWATSTVLPWPSAPTRTLAVTATSFEDAEHRFRGAVGHHATLLSSIARI